MDYSTALNVLHNSFLSSALQMIYGPLKTVEHNVNNAANLDINLFDLKRAYNVPLDVPIDLSCQFKRDPLIEQDQQTDDESEDYEEHHPIEFCESLIEEVKGEFLDFSNKEQEKKEECIDLLEEESDDKYKCCHCLFEGSVLEMRDHYENNHLECEKTNWCPDCLMVFKNDADQRLHQVKEHLFQCSKCSKSFKTQEKLLGHMFVHNKGKGFACPVCRKVFPIHRYMVRHLERHGKKGEKPEIRLKKVTSHEKAFKCIECHKEFTKKESLVKHTKIHTRDSLKCSLCDFTCGKKVILKMHVISHEGNRKYKCDNCDFSFKQIGHLKRHIARFNH